MIVVMKLYVLEYYRANLQVCQLLVVAELCCEIFHFVVDCEYSDNELNETVDLYVNL